LNWNDFCLEIGQKSERTEDRKTVVEGTALIVPLSENRPLTNHVDDGDHDDHYDHDLDDYVDDYDVVYQALEVLSPSD